MIIKRLIIFISLSIFVLNVKAQYISSCSFNAGSSTVNTKIQAVSVLGTAFIQTNFNQQKNILLNNVVLKYSKENGLNFIKLYPNPNSGRIFFNIKNKTNDDYIEVLDLNGRILKKKEFVQVSSGSLNLESFKRGIYFVRFYRKDKCQIIKIIKQ